MSKKLDFLNKFYGITLEKHLFIDILFYSYKRME